jgi:hypothetical protein
MNSSINDNQAQAICALGGGGSGAVYYNSGTLIKYSATNGTDGLGGGGGGSRDVNNLGGRGGCGVVIIRFNL